LTVTILPVPEAKSDSEPTGVNSTQLAVYGAQFAVAICSWQGSWQLAGQLAVGRQLAVGSWQDLQHPLAFGVAGNATLARDFE
jgi:hypothetical protein